MFLKQLFHLNLKRIQNNSSSCCYFNKNNYKNIILRSYHSYPEPNDTPIITEYSLKDKKHNKKELNNKLSSEMINKLTNLKLRFQYDQNYSNFTQNNQNNQNNNEINKQETFHSFSPQITKLENGLTVTSLVGDDMTMSSIVFYIKSGSASENQNESGYNNEQGTSFFLESTAFGYTNDNQEETVSKQLNRIGALDMSTSQREFFMYFVDGMRSNVESIIKLLSSAILNPLINNEVIQEGILNMEFKSQYMDSEHLSNDGITFAAYGQSTLGNKHYPSDLMKLQLLNINSIQNFRSKILFGENCLVAGVGIEHDVLVNYVKDYFKDLPKQPIVQNNTKEIISRYTGGLYVEQRELKEPFVKLTVGFPFDGYRGKHFITACLLERLLGGGSSFSAGGPGKGMYTKLYRDVLCRYDWIESAKGSIVCYNDNGLLGIDGSCNPENVMNLYKVFLHELTKLTIFKVTPEELLRAKNMLKSKLLMQLESRAVIGEDLARQTATFGFREDPLTTCQKIDKITDEDIMNLTRELLLQPPSIACIGEDVSQIANYEQLNSYFINYRDSLWKQFKVTS